MPINGKLIDGRFRIQKMLSSGSYGNVFQGKDKVTGKMVAVKKIKKKHGSIDDTSALNEITILSALRYVEGIPELLTWGESEKLRYFVITWLAGDLATIKERNPDSMFRPETVLKILWSTVNILERIHWMGFLHQDIKMENIMFSYPENKLYLIDFGLARKFVDAGRNRIPPSENFDFSRCRYSAPRAAEGCDPQETEDLIQLAFVGLFLRNQHRFISENPIVLQREKESYMNWVQYYPDLFIDQELHFLLPFQRAVFTQIYGWIPNYQAIRETIERALPIEYLSRPFDIFQENGEIRLM